MADTTRIEYRGDILVVNATVDAGVTVDAGNFVGFDTATGYLVELTDAASRIPLGISMSHTLGTETVDTDIEVAITGIFRMTGVTLAVTDNGAVAYCATATTFDTTSVNGNIVGKIIEYESATVGWVDIGAAAQLTAAGTAISFADTGTYFKVAALAGVTATAALMEDHLDLDQHACDDGDGTYIVTPQTNRQHYAKAIQGNGTGIAYYVHASTALVAKTVARCSGETSGIPTVEPATNTTGTRPAMFYATDAILIGAKGFVYTNYYESATGLAGATGAAIYRGVAGALTLTKPVDANRTQIVGRTLDGAGKAWMYFTEGVVEPHTHEDESTGGAIYFTVALRELTAFTKDGASHTVVTQDYASITNCTVVEAFASVTTACSHADTVVLTLNGSALCAIANGAKVGEATGLAIDIAAAANFLLAATANAGDAAAGLGVTLTCRQNT